MMNTVAKGNRTVRKAVKILEIMGMQVANVELKGEHIKKKDAFGVADLCVIDNRCIPTAIKFIQVTTNKSHPHKLYCKFKESLKADNLHMEQWVWKDRKGFDIYYYSKDTYKHVRYGGKSTIRKVRE